MNEEAVRHWVIKAKGDLKVGKDEMATPEPVLDAVCFHMQQCCEKMLKAFLVFHGQEIPKIHSLAALAHRCCQIDAGFRELIERGLDRLTDYAVEVRYGDDFFVPSREETEQAISMAENVMGFVTQRIA